MSRRLLAVIALAVASSSLTACAESVTAPTQPALSPSTPRLDTFDPSTCKGGWNSSEGRCL